MKAQSESWYRLYSFVCAAMHLLKKRNTQVRCKLAVRPPMYARPIYTVKHVEVWPQVQ